MNEIRGNNMKVGHLFVIGLGISGILGWMVYGLEGTISFLSNFILYFMIGYGIYYGINKISKIRFVSIAVAVFIVVGLRMSVYLFTNT